MKSTIFAMLLAMLLVAPTLASPGSDDMQTIWGTTGLDVKGLLGIGIILCTDLGAPAIDCGEPLSQRGTAEFDVSGWNSGVGSNTGRLLTVWAEQTYGAGTGFGLVVCSDLDNNQVCVGGTDPFATAYSSTFDTNGDGCQKDDKDCGDWSTAGLTLCVPLDTTGTFDTVNVFIQNYVDAETTQNDDVGAGVSEGHYDVYLDYGAFVAAC